MEAEEQPGPEPEESEEPELPENQEVNEESLNFRKKSNLHNLFIFFNQSEIRTLLFIKLKVFNIWLLQEKYIQRKFFT